MVVIFHIFYYYNNIGIEAMFAGAKEYTGSVNFAGLYQYFVYPWFMLLLFVVAGISARAALGKRTNRSVDTGRSRVRLDRRLCHLPAHGEYQPAAGSARLCESDYCLKLRNRRTVVLSCAVRGGADPDAGEKAPCTLWR